ncbi:ELMO/CED-12 family-domain-containing protein [Leucosporidium creatinivorum]|uniref:ELMO/CED-12 family-domain-containing protein n=1 Tax=Leucosporidium creatinivorum TaxID=106004 RepID=A0A1Y2F4P8_9BASI|nr:ELMO/CED-12 family-domain-containing protein [Leucosporidium creatinivorum]
MASTALAGYWELWLTPTISLSFVIESERSAPSLLRLVSRFALYFQPSLTRQSLEYELESRGAGTEGISAATLRVVDAAYYRSLQAQGISSSSTPIYPEELVVSIAATEGIPSDAETYKLLEASLERVLATYSLVDEVVERTETPFVDGNEASEAQLRELFKLLKPEQELSGLVSKQWQEIGFQGTSPKTDFRRLGSLALDSILFFARTYGHRAAEVVDEAVNGGLHWYPLALAMIHMTAFALDMATSRDLQLLLLRSFQAPPEQRGDSSKPDTTPVLAVASELLLLFHAHWLRGGYTVMQFEQVSKEFQEALRPWVRRGVLDGRALGWDTGDHLKIE